MGFNEAFGRNHGTKFVAVPPGEYAPIIFGQESAYFSHAIKFGVVAEINPNNLDTTVKLQYGVAKNTYTEEIVCDAISGSNNIPVVRTAVLPTLKPGKYYWRFQATNSVGETNGTEQVLIVYPGIGQVLVDYSAQLLAAITTMTGTIYYIDPSAETNGDGLTSATPYNTWTAFTTLGGSNRYLQKRGTTYQSTTGTFRTFDGPCYLGVYGEGDDYAYIIAGTNAGTDYISSQYRLIIQDYDIKGYRTAGAGTELGRGIRLSATTSGSTMNHIVYNCAVHNFRTGIDGYMASGYYYGMKVLHSHVYDIGLDGIYPQGPTDIEIAYVNMHDVNNVWFINEDDGTSSGDGIQIGFANGTFPTIHLIANVHHCTIDRTTTRNKFCIIWNEQTNDETVNVYNNHLLCADYATDTDHPVSAIYCGLPTGGTDADLSTTNIYNNLFEGGNYGVRNYVRASTNIHHNVFKNLFTAIASGGGLNIRVYNNVFKDYTSVAIGMGTNPRVVSKNNVFRTSTAAAYAYASIGGMAESNYNNFFGTRINSSAYGLIEWQAEQLHDDNSSDSDPLFTDYTNDNFYPLSTSPLIGAGIDVGITSDFDGVTIPQVESGDPDVGIFEYIY